MTAAAAAASASMSTFMMNMFRRVNWEFVDWNGVNFLLDNDWVWDLDWDFNWIRHLDFLYNWYFDDLDFRHPFVVMLMNGMDRNFYTSDMMFTNYEENS